MRLLAKGSDLRPEDREHVLRAYVHRHTREHVPEWARRAGAKYPVQFASDAEWLANTYFSVTVTGRLDRRVTHCTSSPTWPDNPELRRS
jgi:hypothetical protein